MITFEDIKNNKDVNTYIKKADDALSVMGYTEHAFAHVTKCATLAGDLLKELGYSERIVDLTRITAYMHDIGNVINRHHHAEIGATMVYRILDELNMDVEEIAAIISAIGNHDESTGTPVSEMAAALIIADKSDVRRSRVRNNDFANFDIHDRVNYAVERSELMFNAANRTVTLELSIDSTISAVMDYFEIFLQRMLMCRRAANFLGLKFGLDINGVSLL